MRTTCGSRRSSRCSSRCMPHTPRSAGRRRTIARLIGPTSRCPGYRDLPATFRPSRRPASILRAFFCAGHGALRDHGRGWPSYGLHRRRVRAVFYGNFVYPSCAMLHRSVMDRAGPLRRGAPLRGGHRVLSPGERVRADRYRHDAACSAGDGGRARRLSPAPTWSSSSATPCSASIAPRTCARSRPGCERLYIESRRRLLLAPGVCRAVELEPRCRAAYHSACVGRRRAGRRPGGSAIYGASSAARGRAARPAPAQAEARPVTAPARAPDDRP